MRSYRHRHVVTLDETNLVGNVYFAQHVRWQGHCREHFLADHAPGTLVALTGGELTLVTVSCAMDYYAECFAFDHIDIDMTLRSRGGNRISMNFDFRRGESRVASGSQTVACMQRCPTGIRPVEVPVELAAALEHFG